MAGGAGVRVGRAVVTAALVVGGLGCSGDEGTFDAALGEVTASDVIEATTGAGTARATITTHASTADPPDDHGRSGYEEQELTAEVEYDFDRDRSVSRWELDLGGLVADELPAMRVEARSIGDTAYVRDGSWLCPGCGLDGPPLPSDEWIVVPTEPGGAFAFAGVALFSGELGWLALVDSPVRPRDAAELDGEPVRIYEVSVPIADVQPRLDALSETGLGIELQGQTVTITFWVDGLERLRRLVVSYREGDRDHTITATLRDFGDPVEIEPPPESEIYQG